jgi:hypothetical protein
MINNPDSRTRIDEIGDGVYRISTPVTVVPGGFTFNEFLIVDDEPLLFHTGLRQLFSLVRQAIDTVIPAERLRYVSFHITKRTSAARSTTSSVSHPTPCRSAARSLRLFRKVSPGLG